EHHARLEDLRRLLLVDEPHLRAAVPLVLDQALLREPHERGAHGGAARMEHPGQVGLDEALVRLQPPTHDRLSQLLVRTLRDVPRGGGRVGHASGHRIVDNLMDDLDAKNRTVYRRLIATQGGTVGDDNTMRHLDRRDLLKRAGAGVAVASVTGAIAPGAWAG